MAKEISQNATVNITVNGKEANQVLKQNEDHAKKLRKEIEELIKKQGDHNKEIQKLRKELNQTESIIKKLKTEAAQTDEVLRRLDKATPKELNKTLKQLRGQLNGIERGSAAWDAQVAKIKRVKAEIARVNDEMRVTQTRMERLRSWFDKWSNSLLAAAASLSGVILAGRSAVKAFAEMEEEMANTQKFCGLTTEEVKALNEEFKKMDTRTSREQLNQLAQEAGRLGKNTQESIMGYVKAADILNVALSDLGEGATQKIAKLSNIFKIEDQYGTYDSMLKIGSVINVLSQNCTASKPYLVEFTNRLAGVGSQANMTIQQIVGLGAVLDANAQKVEASATAIAQVLTRMFIDPAKYASVAGLEVESFTKLLKKDANEALIQFLTALNQAGNMDVLAPMFKDMGEKGSRAIAALSTLAGHIDEVRWQQENANQAFEEGTSVLHEYNIFNQTTQAGLEKAKKRLNEVAVELGEKLAPVMKHVMSSTSLTMKALSSAVSFFIEYKKQIILVIAAIVAYTVALKSNAIITAAATSASKAWNAVLIVGNKIIPVLKVGVAGVTNAIQYFTKGLQVNYTMQQRWHRALAAVPLSSWIGLVSAATAAIGIFVSSLVKSSEKARQAKKELEEFRKAIRDIDEASAQYAAKETNRLEQLYKAATNDKLAREERIKAVQEMQRLYPSYFGNLSQEMIMAGEMASAYYDLKNSILETARAKAAAGLLEENQKELLNLELKEEQLRKDIKEATDIYESAKKINESTGFLISAYGGGAAKEYGAKNNLKKLNDDLEANLSKQREYLKANEELAKKYNLTIGSKEEGTIEPEVITSSNSDDEDSSKKAKKGSKTDKFQAEKDWREYMEAKAKIAYRTGENDYREYTRQMNEIAIEYYRLMLEHTDLSESERMKIMSQYHDARAKAEEDSNKTMLEAMEIFKRLEIAQINQMYMDDEISKEARDTKIEELEIEHQRTLLELTEEGSEERLVAEEKYNQLLIKQKERLAAETAKKEAEYKKNQEKYFGNTPESRMEKYEKALKVLDETYALELEKFVDNEEAKLHATKEYEKQKLALKKEYLEEGEKGYKSAILAAAAWLKSEAGQAFTGSMDAIVSGMSAIFSQLNSYIEADIEYQTALVGKRYDKEIEMAKGNSKLVSRLEKQKEKEIAKVKNEANRKMFAMQVIQAVAQTAQNAINAFGSASAIPVVGHIIAPIAAASAIAAGMVQIAAIKKQQQAAEATGYAEGGYTRPGSRYQVAGVVHAGEWVASQDLVNNPQTAPIIALLDRVQRSNTIASISSSDAGLIAGSFPAVAKSGAAGAGNQSNPETIVLIETLTLLYNRLQKPFYTVNSMTGENGIKQTEDDYNRYIRNKSKR